MAQKDELGRRGERLAADYLIERGITILERNWRCSQGELDLVALDRGTLVFVEVKTRSGVRYGHPFEAITAQKLARLRRLAGAWRAAHPEPRIAGLRLDAVAVVAERGAEPVIEHLRGIG